MRESTNPNRFSPESPPTEASGAAIIEWVMRQFRLLAALTDVLADGQLEEVHVEPAKPRTGMIRLADGTDWDPGSGRGVYWYDAGSATWKLLG
jgi:hypothetical protein